MSWPHLLPAFVYANAIACIAAAQDTVWITNADGDFGTSSNWTAGVPDATTAVAHFGSDFPSDRTVTLKRSNFFSDNIFTLARLYINPAPGGGNFAFVPAVSSLFGPYGAFEFRRTDEVAPRIDLTRGSTRIDAPITLASPTTFHIADGASMSTNGQVSGDGGIIKDGDGTLYLNNSDTQNNTYRGLTVINDGVLVMTNFRSLGYQAPEGQGGPNGVVINSGGTLLFDKTVDYAPSKPISVLGDGHNGMGAMRVASGRQLGWQEVTFRPGETKLYVEADHPTRGATMLSFGNIKGSGDIIKYGAGIFDLEIPSPEFTGTVTVREGLFHLRHFTDSLGQASRLTLASRSQMELIFDQFDPPTPIERIFNPTPTTIGGFNGGGGVLWRLDDTAEPVTGTRAAPRTAVWTGNVTLDDDLIVDVARAEDTMHFTGTLRGSGGISKGGSGTLVLPELTPRLLYVHNGVVRMDAGAPDRVHRLRDYTIAASANDPMQASATVDVTNHYLVLEYGPGGTATHSPTEMIRNRLRSGLLHGTGLLSSTAPAGHRVGYVESGLLGWYNIGNEILDPTSLVVGVMANGDTNFDGLLNEVDFRSLQQHFGSFGRTWSQGDFDYDGAVWTSDFNLLGGHFGIIASPSGVTDGDWARLASAMNVPEPATGVAFFVSMAALLRRRRHIVGRNHSRF